MWIRHDGRFARVQPPAWVPLDASAAHRIDCDRRPATTTASAGSGGVSAATAAAGAAMAAKLAEAERRRQEDKAAADKAKFASDRVRAWYCLHGRLAALAISQVNLGKPTLLHSCGLVPFSCMVRMMFILVGAQGNARVAEPRLSMSMST